MGGGAHHVTIVLTSFIKKTTSGNLPASFVSSDAQWVVHGAELIHGNSSSTNPHAFFITEHVSVISRTTFVHPSLYTS